jgi:hypothetical protein
LGETVWGSRSREIELTLKKRLPIAANSWLAEHWQKNLGQETLGFIQKIKLPWIKLQ